jgi:hypothetical protein
MLVVTERRAKAGFPDVVNAAATARELTAIVAIAAYFMVMTICEDF